MFFFHFLLFWKKEINNNKIQQSIFKDTGVKKLHFLGLCGGFKENYDNVIYKLVDFSDIDDTNFTWTGDQKIGHIMCGSKGARAKKPCIYCLAMYPFTAEDQAELRTLGKQYILWSVNTLFFAYQIFELIPKWKCFCLLVMQTLSGCIFINNFHF